MFIGISKKLKALGGLRIGVGKRMNGVGGWLLMFGLAFVYLYWYMILGCLWLLYGICWLFYLPINCIVKAIKRKRTARKNSEVK